MPVGRPPCHAAPAGNGPAFVPPERHLPTVRSYKRNQFVEAVEDSAFVRVVLPAQRQ